MQASVWVLGDQLSLDHYPGLGDKTRPVLLVESRGRKSVRRYHSHKLVLVLSAMRHFADELRGQGYTVDYRQADDFADGVRAHLAESGSAGLVTMAASEYDTRRMQQGLSAQIGVPVEVLPNTLFLSNRARPDGGEQAPRTIMEPFYRNLRAHYRLLLDGDGPVGGKWNLDKENRGAWDPKQTPMPPHPAIEPDATTLAVVAQVAREFPDAFGDPQTFALPVTRAQALTWLDHFIAHGLPLFGTYEDAMAQDEHVLFHSWLTPMLNLGLLDPLECVQASEQAYRQGHAPLASTEGFIRQIVGWREYIYQRYWQMMPGLRDVNHYGFTRPLPPFFWGDGRTDMNCLDQVITKVLATGYSHHIERLMVVCNWCLLAGIVPGEVAEWFLATYADAYDWVVLPNVLGMALYADGGQVATKPYIASANYINGQGDYCKHCRYDPKKRVGEDACPFNSLYWSFVSDHAEELARNPRARQMTFGLGRLTDLAETRAQAQGFLRSLPMSDQKYT